MHKGPTKTMTINAARPLMESGRLTTSTAPEHQGRSGRFWPIILDGVLLKLNNLTVKLDYPSLRASNFLTSVGYGLGSAQRFGILLAARAKGHYGDVEKKELVNFCRDLNIPQDDDGNYVIKLALNGDKKEQ